MRSRNAAGMMMALVLFTATALAQTGPRAVAGDVVKFDGSVLQVRTNAGSTVDINVKPQARISLRSAGTIAQVQQGKFVGVTAAPGDDGALVASEIQIFPEQMRGTGEGHRPMTGTNTMTNATISSIATAPAGSTTTNATVSTVAGARSDPRLTLTYKGGEKVVIVPANATILVTEVGDPSALVPGAHVVVQATTQDDGVLATDRISVGKAGFVPTR